MSRWGTTHPPIPRIGGSARNGQESRPKQRALGTMLGHEKIGAAKVAKGNSLMARVDAECTRSRLCLGLIQRYHNFRCRSGVKTAAMPSHEEKSCFRWPNPLEGTLSFFFTMRPHRRLRLHDWHAIELWYMLVRLAHGTHLTYAVFQHDTKNRPHSGYYSPCVSSISSGLPACTFEWAVCL